MYNCRHMSMHRNFFFLRTGVWTQDGHLEPLHQPFLVMGFSKIVLGLCPRLALIQDPPDLCLLSSKYYRPLSPSRNLLSKFKNLSSNLSTTKHKTKQSPKICFKCQVLFKEMFSTRSCHNVIIKIKLCNNSKP
jgi:hypothetical protein